MLESGSLLECSFRSQVRRSSASELKITSGIHAHWALQVPSKSTEMMNAIF